MVDLAPKAISKPYGGQTQRQRILLTSEPSIITSEKASDGEPEKEKGTSDWFCDRLFEIPSLRGVKVAQIATGGRTSFARTSADGRVLAWGANEYGYVCVATFNSGICFDFLIVNVIGNWDLVRT